MNVKVLFLCAIVALSSVRWESEGMIHFIFVSPHQDDEWLAYAKFMRTLQLDNQRRNNYSIDIVIVTKSLWPDLESYEVREAESAAAANYLGASVHYLGLTEEELFDPPYAYEDYIGDEMEGDWSPVLLDLLLRLTNGERTILAYPSELDGTGHPVHEFTRNITLAIKDDEGLNLIREMQYTLRVTEHPENNIYYTCEPVWKAACFVEFYPSQWAVIEADPDLLELFWWCCTYEYEYYEFPE